MGGDTGKLGRFAQLRAADKCLFLRAVFWLGVSRARLAVTPFRRLSESLAAQPVASVDDVDPDYLERVGFAIRAAANNVPWRSDCFPQAIAARMMVRSEGYSSTIHFGVEKADEGEIAGHAWVTCGEFVVTGGGRLDRYTEMYCINA